jgi:hypothetical protein
MNYGVNAEERLSKTEDRMTAWYRCPSKKAGAKVLSRWKENYEDERKGPRRNTGD